MPTASRKPATMGIRTVSRIKKNSPGMQWRKLQFCRICIASEEMAMQYIVLKPNPIPIAATAVMMSRAFTTKYDSWAGTTPPVAYWMTVHRPIIPPADIPLGIIKHSQAAAKTKQARVIVRYSFRTRGASESESFFI